MHDEIEYAPLAPAHGAPSGEAQIEYLHDVPVELAVEIGRTRMTIGETLKLGPGSIVSLNRLAGEPVDLLVNGKPIARGEVVVIDEEFGLRITQITSSSRVVDADPATQAPTQGAVRDPALMSDDDVAAYLGGGGPALDDDDDLAAYLAGAPDMLGATDDGPGLDGPLVDPHADIDSPGAFDGTLVDPHAALDPDEAVDGTVVDPHADPQPPAGLDAG